MKAMVPAAWAAVRPMFEILEGEAASGATPSRRAASR